MPPLEARGLDVYLGSTQILHDIGFEVQGPAWVGVIGPNGSGKTTLLRTVAGLLPYRGHLTLDGVPLRDWKPGALAQRMAFVRQAQTLAFDFSVAEFVLLGRSPHRRWLEPFTRTDRQRANEALREVDLNGFEQRSITTLSGGELQRARLAQALARDAPLLLLDEPTAHLDVHHQLDLMERTASLVTGGRTVLSALHDLNLAARFVDRVLVLHEGRLVADGAPGEVLRPSLLRDVFRVRAELSADDHTSIRFLAPA